MAIQSINEIRETIQTIEKKIFELNEMKGMLKEIYIYCYIDLDTKAEIKKVIDKVKEKVLNL